MKIRFCGAAVDVTGSCHLISTEKHKILLDCGQFQGGAEADGLNRGDFPFNPAEIDAVILSHAHVDHCGRLPLLYKRGYKGPVYATDATVQLAEIMLKDSAHINEQETENRNRKLQRAGKPLEEPLFDTDDALDTITHLKPVVYDTLAEINDEMKICFNDAGHILGSAITELWVCENGITKKIVFSGDLGMTDRPILRDPKYIKKADCVIIESTYGNRVHEPNPTSVDRLMEIIAETVKNGGNVVIPSFAVGRTQELIFELNKIYDGHTEYTELLRNVPVYVDSPMSIEATEVFRRNAQAYDEEMKNYILSGDHPLDFSNLHYSKTSDESRMINADTHPKVILSASGMCDAGRIRHHLKHNLWNPKCAVVFVGYQAKGTLGRMLLDGIKEVKLFGEAVAVNARIYNLGGFSGHADRNGLYDWLCGFQKEPSDIFLVHGDYEAKTAFADYIKESKGWNATVVNGYDEYDLSTGRCSHADCLTSEDQSAEEDFVSARTAQKGIELLDSARLQLDSVISNAKLELSGIDDDAKLAEIHSRIAELHKSIINLGASLSK